MIVTGREDKWSFLTTTWLTEHGIEYDELHMRGAKDYRPDTAVKADIARAIAKQYKVVVAVDDRDDIIAVWQRAGIATMRVSWGGELGKVERLSGFIKTMGMKFIERRSASN